MSAAPVIVPAWRASALAASAGMSVDDVRERLEFMVAIGDLTRLECGAHEPLYAVARAVEVAP